MSDTTLWMLSVCAFLTSSGMFVIVCNVLIGATVLKVLARFVMQVFC